MSTGPQPTAQPAPATAKPPLIDAATDQALAGVGDVLQGDQRMAGAEGPLQGHPQGLQAIVENAPALARATGAGQAALDAITDGATALGGLALSGVHGITLALPVIQAIIRPVVQNAIRFFARALHDRIIVPLEAELAAIAASHPDVNLDRARAHIGSFYDAVPDVPRTAPVAAPAPVAQTAAPGQPPATGGFDVLSVP